MSDMASKEETVCPYHEDVERRLQEGQEKFDRVIQSLDENTQAQIKLRAKIDNHNTDIQTLKRDMYGNDNQNDGLKAQYQKIRGALAVIIILIGGSGGVWTVFQVLKALKQ